MNNHFEIRRLHINNLSKAKQLKDTYKEVFKKTYRALRMDVKKSLERENAISDLIDMLLNAMNESRPVSDLFTDGYEEFYHDLLGILPIISQKSKQNRRKLKKCLTAITGLLICFLVTFGVLWQIGYIGMRKEGISYLACTLDKYSYKSEIIEKGYSIDINLTDLDSNIGKILYDKDNCTIVVSGVDNNPVAGGYSIFFRAQGQYSLKSGKLVSGQKHYATESRWYSTSITAKMNTEYKGKNYQGEIAGESGLIYVDGDEFGFYLFPQKIYAENIVNLYNSKDLVKVTVSDLCVNTWNRK